MTTKDYQSLLSLPYAPSSYQADIFHEVEHGRGNIVVEAVAGSGKSTTLECVCRLIRDAVVVAFNRDIASEMDRRLKAVGADATGRTAHSVGVGAVRATNRGRVNVNNDKYVDMLWVYQREIQESGSLLGRSLDRSEIDALTDANAKKPRLPIGPIRRLLDLARLNLVDFSSSYEDFAAAMVSLLDHHGLDIPVGTDHVVFEAVRRAGLTGRDMTTTIDYTDMIWLPVIHNYNPKKYSWVLVDECQDLSPCILALLRKCVKRGGRMLFVGDRRQAIYGFAGADARSFEQIVDVTKAKLLPLSVCYRCPTKVLDAAREYCPQIEARDGAPEGVVRDLPEEKLTAEIKEGDMILCRKNAPLVSACFSLIAEGIAATIRGRDIGKGLVSAIQKICKQSGWDRFESGLENWRLAEVNAAKRRGGNAGAVNSRIQGVEDKAECIRIVYARSGAESERALVQAVESLFSDNRSSVTLSTIHKAKGLENERVFILGATELSFRGQQDWQREQEHNLTYVATTRAMSELVFVEMTT